MKKAVASILGAMGLAVAFAADPVTVSTTEELVNALNTYNGKAQVIQLEPHDYVLPDEPMQTDANNGQGAIFVNKVTLRGLGKKPEDVKLVGNGSIRAVLCTNSPRFENLMITNGNTTAGCKGTDGKTISNSTRGGGIYGAGVITNCVITGCKGSHGGAVATSTSVYCSHLHGNSASYGGAVFNTSVYGSLLEDNTAGSGGAGWFNGKNYKVFDSQVLNNQATARNDYGGGLYGIQNVSNCVLSGNSCTNGGAGACYSKAGVANSFMWDCIVTNNTANGSGGGIGGLTAIRCLIAGNSAAGSGGGSSLADLYDCVVSNNVVTGGNGGGASLDGNVVSNCLVYANHAISATSHAYGGGIYCASTAAKVIDTQVVGNYAETGEGSAKLGLTGGVQFGTIIGGSVHDNYADSLCGGCREGVAIGCRIYNNDSGDIGKNCHSMRLINCDISDNSVSYGRAYGCTFHDIVNGRSHTLTNNPFKADHTYSSIAAVWDYHMNATNCLFRGNKGIMFKGTNKGGVKASLVNCTLTDNEIVYTFHTFMDPDNLLTVVNCAFVGNTNTSGKACDLILTSCATADGTRGTTFANCIYGATTAANIADYAPDPSTLYQLGKNGIASSPRFNKDGEYPYEPKYSSPLVGRGQVMDWMTGTYDIRGDIAGGKYLRLRDGKADIGCYQCWLDPIGMVLFVR